MDKLKISVSNINALKCHYEEQCNVLRKIASQSAHNDNVNGTEYILHSIHGITILIKNRNQGYHGRFCPRNTYSLLLISLDSFSST